MEMKALVVLVVVLLSTWATFITAVDLSWDLRTVNKEKYTELISGLRTYLKGSSCFEIPMIGAAPKPTVYVHIKLIVSTTQNMVIALRKSDAYVIAYEDTFNGKPRAFILDEDQQNAKKDAFPDAFKANQVVELRYGGSYAALEEQAGISRRNLVLTRKTFQSTAASIYGVENIKDAQFKKNQAKLFLLAAQMVAEATRFDYIATQVKKYLNDDSFKYDDKIYSIVKKWDTISSAVAIANPDGTLQTPITLVDPSGNDIKVKEVRQVKTDMGLLKYIKPCQNNVNYYCAATCPLNPILSVLYI